MHPPSVQDALANDREGEGTVFAGAQADAQQEDAATVLVNDRLVEDYVKSPKEVVVAEAMSERAVFETVRVLRLACATGKAPFIIIALGALERLVARGFLQGEVVSLMLEGEGRTTGDTSMNSRGLSDTPEQLPVAAQALHLICCCEDFGHEEEVEVRHPVSSSVLSAPAVRWPPPLSHPGPQHKENVLAGAASVPFHSSTHGVHIACGLHWPFWQAYLQVTKYTQHDVLCTCCLAFSTVSLCDLAYGTLCNVYNFSIQNLALATMGNRAQSTAELNSMARSTVPSKTPNRGAHVGIPVC
jgi:hypothetical protein